MFWKIKKKKKKKKQELSFVVLEDEIEETLLTENQVFCILLLLSNFSKKYTKLFLVYKEI